MTYEYFIASRFRNRDIVLQLAQALRQKKKSVYCFVETEASKKNVGDLHEDAEISMQKWESKSDWRNAAGVKEVFETDMHALKNSKTVILLLPAGKSAHIEAGVGYGLGKKMIVVGEQKETESLYLIFDETYASTKDFVTSLD